MSTARCVVQCMLFDVNIIVRDICRNKFHGFTLNVAMIESNCFVLRVECLSTRKRNVASTSALYLQKILLIHDCAKMHFKIYAVVLYPDSDGVLCAAATFPASTGPNLVW